MPEFRLRYKLPADLSTDWEVKEFVGRVTKMAEEIQKVTENVFTLSVVWEIREFGISRGMADFDVVGWVTDNDDSKVQTALEAQTKILERMSQLTTQKETVSCWFQRVKGKWGETSGIMN